MDETTFNQILESLKKTLGVTEENDVAILEEILNDAISEVKAARHYPSDMRASDISDDLQKYISNVKKLAKYDYNQVGVEYQTTHNENGISRSYMNREKCFDGIVPFCTQF